MSGKVAKSLKLLPTNLRSFMVEIYKYIDKLSMLCVARWLVLTREKYAKDLVSRGYTEDNARYWAERKVLPRKVSGNSYAHSWSEPSVSGTAVNKKFGADLRYIYQKLQNDVANQGIRSAATRYAAWWITSWRTSWTTY
ncbi:MAG: hypothetical protein IPG42_20940 [Betaproteobacteria bacterium]|nr:hypothetical protein [Betaproteobacteria bacterium]